MAAKNTVWGLAMVGVMSAASVTGVAQAQWTTDPLANTLVSGGSGDQGVPLIVPTSDGGVWISFMSNTGTGYKPMIQRLDREGHVMLAGNGVVLADRHNTATFNYDLKIDPAGSAIVVFDDDSTGTTVVTVQKVMADGTLPWGATGKQVPNTANVLGAKVVACADGTYVVAWSLSNVLNFQRLDTNGSLVGAAWTVADAGHYQAVSDLRSTGTGGEFASLWVRGETTSATTSRKGLKIQKWSGSNAAMWNSGTAIDIYTSAVGKSIQNGYFPVIVNDSAGGAIVAWYDNGTTRNAWLQHVLSDGTMRFAAEGLAMSTTSSATEYRLSASVAYDDVNQLYVVGYEVSNPLQSLFGLSVQSVDAAGSLLWGPSGTGAVVLPMTQTVHSSFIQSFAGGNGKAYLVWIQYTGAVTQEIQATKLSSTGTSIWTPAITRMATRVSTKGRLSAVPSATKPMAIAVWADNGSGTNDIYAQNIAADGLLGPICDADFNLDRVVDFFDYLDFVSALSDQAWDADVNHDGVVDFFDYLDFVQSFSSGC